MLFAIKVPLLSPVLNGSRCQWERHDSIGAGFDFLNFDVGIIKFRNLTRIIRFFQSDSFSIPKAGVMRPRPANRSGYSIAMQVDK